MFDEAQDEIFQLMERDTFARFKSDPTNADKLANDMITRLDKDNNGRINYPEFRKWALNEPVSLVFFSGLVDAAKTFVILDDTPKTESI